MEKKAWEEKKDENKNMNEIIWKKCINERNIINPDEINWKDNKYI